MKEKVVDFGKKVYTYFKTRKSFHMLQQNWYNDGNRYLKWINNSYKPVKAMGNPRRPLSSSQLPDRPRLHLMAYSLSWVHVTGLMASQWKNIV